MYRGYELGKQRNCARRVGR